MILLTLETSHFIFHALGETDLQARTALRQAAEYHAEQYGLAATWWQEMDVRCQEIAPGECHRDYSLLYRGA